MSAVQPRGDGSRAVGARERSARMAEFQRSRLLKAAVAVASEHGYAGTTATAVIARARVSRKTFYDIFEDREACFLAAVEGSLAQMAAVVEPAYEAQGSWSERLRMALVALLVFAEHQPEAAALVLSYASGYGPASVEPRASVLQVLRRAVDEGRSQPRAREDLSPLTAEFVVSGALAVIHSRLQQRPSDLSELVNQLMSIVVLPYIGAAAAGRQLIRALPTTTEATSPTSENEPLSRLGMRLTYRTVSTLEAIATSPGANNMQVGAEVGIFDQGQISKLLSRLAGLGLIVNTGLGQTRGGSNAWYLTPAGRQLEGEVRHRATDARSSA
jgi:AcrR family transcriptional regulator